MGFALFETGLLLELGSAGLIAPSLDLHPDPLLLYCILIHLPK